MEVMFEKLNNKAYSLCAHSISFLTIVIVLHSKNLKQ